MKQVYARARARNEEVERVLNYSAIRYPQQILQIRESFSECLILTTQSHALIRCALHADIRLP